MVALADSDNIWHTLGRLEEGLRRLEERLSSLEATMLENQRRTDTALLEVNRRIDRLFYAVIAIGGALLVATLVGSFVGS